MNRTLKRRWHCNSSPESYAQHSSFSIRVGKVAGPIAMRPKGNEFRDLCRGLVRKDADAVARFRRGVVPHLHTVVRRALRSDRNLSPLGRRLQTAAREFQAKKAGHSTRADESCVSYLALRLCNLLIQAVRSTPGPSPDETILRVLDSGTLPDEPTLARKSPR